MPCFVWADGMMIVKLPPPPNDGESFVVGYVPNMGTYRLGETDYSGSIYISEDGVLIDNYSNKIKFKSLYELVNGSWVKYSDGAYWQHWYDDIGFSYQKGKVVVEGVNMVTKAVKANPMAGIQGGLIKMEAPMSASKVMLYCPKCEKPTRIRHEMVDGKKTRVCKKCGEQLDI